MAGQTRGAIGLSLIFCFFCIKAKEKAKTKPLGAKNSGSQFNYIIKIKTSVFCLSTVTCRPVAEVSLFTLDITL